MLLTGLALQGMAQPAPVEIEAVPTALADVLSLATFGAVSIKAQSADVTRSGDAYEIRMPLGGFATPVGAALTATARPLPGGAWDITSLAFPASTSIGMPSAGPAGLSYAIGRQAITARIDPTNATPSTLDADIGDIRVRSDNGKGHSEQSVSHYVAHATAAAGANGLMAMASRGDASDWHIAADAGGRVPGDLNMKRVTGDLTIGGLDRVNAAKLRVAVDAIRSNPPTADKAQQRAALNDLLDALDGLLTHIELRQALEGIGFSGGAGIEGTLERMQVALTADTVDQRLSARLGIAMDALVLPLVPEQFALYVPRHLTLEPVFRGVRTGPLLALLRAANEPDADPKALNKQAAALLNDPGAMAGIESIAFDSGPLRVNASARFVPDADGAFGAHVHVSATGTDALLAQAQQAPALRQVLPFLFIAKGMAKAGDDGALVWDIDEIGDGPVRINGTPIGQPPGKTR
jgi:hypothetical protein